MGGDIKRRAICLMFFWLGVIFSAIGLSRYPWFLDLLQMSVPVLALLIIGIAVSLWLVRWLIKLLRKLFGRVGGLLPIALALSLVSILGINVIYTNGTPEAWLVTAIICYIIYGVCISGHSTQPHTTNSN